MFLQPRGINHPSASSRVEGQKLLLSIVAGSITLGQVPHTWLKSTRLKIQKVPPKLQQVVISNSGLN
jgi:hypothetical protein